jgi:putative transcriptional regulator
MSNHAEVGFFERLKRGMEQSIAHSRGEMSLKTTTLPAPPPSAGRAQVVALRTKLNMSQSIFAATLNVSTKLVQSWEQGSRKPDRGELRLIQLLASQPGLVHMILGGGPMAQPEKKRPTRKAASRKRTASAA